MILRRVSECVSVDTVQILTGRASLALSGFRGTTVGDLGLKPKMTVPKHSFRAAASPVIAS